MTNSQQQRKQELERMKQEEAAERNAEPRQWARANPYGVRRVSA